MKLTPNIKEKIKKRILKMDLDPASIDISGLWDSSLSLRENWVNLQEQNCFKEAETLKELKVKDELNHIQLIEKIVQETKEREDKAIELIKSESPNIDKYFKIPITYIKSMIKSEEITSLIIQGETGLGKSHICLQTLNEEKLEKGKDYEVLSGYVTPLKFYSFLYENKDRIVVLDDIPNVFTQETSYHILLSVLWNISKERTITYDSTSEKLKVPDRFIFTGKVVFLTNETSIPNPLVSRCLNYTIDLTYNQKIRIMYEIAKARNIPLEIMDFIRDNTDESTENLNFRTLIKINGLAQVNKSWKELALEQLKQNEYIRLVKQLSTNYSKVGEAIKQWGEQTGMSRASFFRYKKYIAESLKVATK